MNLPQGGKPPFRVTYSERCRDATRRLLERARTIGQFSKVAQAIEEIQRRLDWIALDEGDPLRDSIPLGLQERILTVPPLVVRYSVDEARRIVYVLRPFKLLPRSGLEE